MIEIEDVYAKIEEHKKKGLPFVIYRKGKSDIVKAFLQQDKTNYDVNYMDSGFIFSPFDHAEKGVFFPVKKSTYIEAKFKPTEFPSGSKSIGQNNPSKNKHDKDEHISLVKEGIKEIQSGVCSKIVLSRKEELSIIEKPDHLLIFKQLLKLYANAFVYYWYHPEIGVWIGATPETLLYVKGNRLETMSLAGTQSFIPNEIVEWRHKEKEEQKMVTDFIIEELSPLVKSIETSDTYTHRAGSLLHLRTDIVAVLDSKKSDLQQVISILHPTPAVCGVPKKSAKSFIEEHESYDRKFYTGYLGEINLESKEGIVSNVFVNLRCMEVQDQKAILYVGGGITKDSDPEQEWKETIRKTETMKRAMVSL